MSEYLTDNVRDYNVLEIINSGYFSTCYKVVHRNGGRNLNLQAIDYGSMQSSDREALEAEIKLLGNMNHQNVAQWLKCINHLPTLTFYILMELCEGGDLEGLIRKSRVSNTCIGEPFMWSVLYHVARGLHGFQTHLPNACMLYCDVSPSSVFWDKHGTIKIGGFKLAQKASNSHNAGGVQAKRPGDVHKLGQLTHQLASLTLTEVPRGELKMPPCYSPDLRRMVAFMLHAKAETVESVVYHPLVVSHVAINSLQSLTLECKEEREVRQASGRSSANSEERCLRCREWEGRVEGLRQREMAVKAREAGLREREHGLCRREKQLAVMERLGREKVLRAEVYLSQSRKARRAEEPQDLNDSSYSADPGDTSVQPTVSKLDPDKIIKPAFLRNATNRRTVHFETLHVDDPATCPYPKPNPHVSALTMKRKGKENKPRKGLRGSMLSLQVSTKELANGILETHLL